MDEAVVRRLAVHVGAGVGPVYGKRGKPDVLARLAGYNRAAAHAPWLVLLDLDESACAPLLRAQVLRAPASQMCFRVAVHATESWLIADAIRFSRFMSVPLTRLPADADSVEDPKALVVNLARSSRSGSVRRDMVPTLASGRKVGPLYVSRLIEFVTTEWRPTEAADRSDSLSRCLRRLRELVAAA